MKKYLPTKQKKSKAPNVGAPIPFTLTPKAEALFAKAVA